MEFLKDFVLPILMGLIGGFFALAMGVSGWLGRIVADRLLASAKAGWDGDLKKLQGRIDRTIFVHRAHFDTEFAALQDLWKQVAKLRAVFPTMEHPGSNPAAQEAARKAVLEANAELIRSIDQQSPFYAKEIYAHLDELRVLAKLALSDYREEHAGNRTVDRDYGGEVRRLAEKISDQIRVRIESLTVVS